MRAWLTGIRHMTNSLDPHNARAYRKRARPMLFIGALMFAVGLRGYLLPATVDDSAAHKVLGSLTYGVWHASLTVAGLIIVYGLTRLRPEIEVIGLWVSAWAVSIHGLAVAAVFGWRATSTVALVLVCVWVLWGRIADLREIALRERPAYDRRRRRREKPR